MSDTSPVVERWKAPFFEEPRVPEPQASLEEREALAQARGYQAGREEGLAAGREEAARIVAALEAVAKQMAQPFEALEEVVSRELAQMAMQLAEQIVRRELTLDSTAVVAVVQEALSTLYKLQGEIVIFLNPADASLVSEFAPESLEGKSWKIVEDPELFPGGCQVKTPTSFVDASVEKRLESVFEELLKSFEKGMEN